MVNITILNPNDKIYGKLSNNYLHWMMVGKQNYPSVTNYIYSNMLLKPWIRAQLTTLTPVKDVYPKFLELLQLERNTIIKLGVENAYKSKFSQPELLTQLMATGNTELLYMGSDSFLGIGVNRNGFNYIGKYLMQLRRQKQLAIKDVEKSKLQEQKDKELYDIFVAYKALESLITYKKDNLKEYVGKTPQEIIDMIGKDEVMKKAPTLENFRKTVELRLLPPELYIAVTNPTILAEIVRKQQLRNLRTALIQKKKTIILEMYVDYLLAKNYPYLTPEQYPEAREQQFRKLGLQSLSELKNRVESYYEKGLLSERLSKNIDGEIISINIPTEEEVEAVELVVFTKVEQKVEEIPTAEQQKPIEINSEDSIFSAVDDSVLFKVDKYLYPTVAHYITTLQLANVPTIGSMDTAYSYIVDPALGPIQSKANFYNLHSILLKYNKIYLENFSTRLLEHMKIGLDKKFENREFQNLLLITGNSNLLWGQKDDTILGIGTKEAKGQNQVGKYLEKIRENIKLERKDEDLVEFTTDEIMAVIEDPIMFAWIQMRLNDMCYTIYASKNYTEMKTGTPIKINPEFVQDVVDKIYQPCSNIYEMVDEVTAQLSQKFRTMVQKCPGFSSVGHDVVDILWKRIVVVLYYLVKYTQKTSISPTAFLADLRRILATVERLVTQDNNCLDLSGTPQENCILSALVNVIRNIIEFNKKLGLSTEIGKTEIDLAKTIILGKDISDEIIPVVKKPRYFINEKGKKQEVITEDDEFIYAKQEAQKIMDQQAKDFWLGIKGEDVGEDVGEDLGGDQGEDVGPDIVPIEEEDDEFAEEVDDYDEDEDEKELWDDDAVPSDPGSDFFSAKITTFKLQQLLETIPEITDISTTIELLLGALETIKTYRMPDRIKTNRVNFFATQL
jgi:predicted NAD-dependent protein-ADP-ribosyltransferase YbiA (DUF1768 family)